MLNPKTLKELISAGGYVRVSTPEQSMKGLSLEAQIAEIKDYCRRRGFQLTKIYVDRGITARKNLYKRAAFMEMMQDVQDHKINHIVILRLDRFFRNVYDYHRMMNEYLIPNDCGWSAVKEDYDTTTTNGRLMINLRLSIAEQECDQDSDRIKDVFDNRVKDGYVITGAIPIGVAIEDHRLVPNEDAHIVKDIFDTFLAKNSVRETMNVINNKHHLNLAYNRISKILRNEIYIGKYRDNEKYCQPIVDEEVFEKVKLELSRNVKKRNTKRVYTYTSLLVCSHCGRKMAGCYGKYTKGHSYYRCNNRWKDKACDNNKTITEYTLDNYIVENVENLLNDYIVKIEAKEKSQSAIKGNRDKIQAKIDRLTDLFVNGMIDMEELKKRKAELEAQIIEDVVPTKTDLSAVNAFLNSGFTNIYYDLTIEERQTLLRSVIKEIHLNSSGIESIIFL